ncbi:MAG TPA: histidine--tRNA ligase [Thermodesulfobacteriota bacterium]|nr:histidine--tRNA ligase [Thermodesulfobacteriota bacterium]
MEARSIRGFHDILPEDIKRWHDIEEKAKSVFELHGYSELRMPVLEFTEIFARSLGSTTDIVEKEMYTFTDRDGSSLTLRPEGTAGVVRAYIENSMWAKSPVTKLYYTGMMFRHERPQKGRFRGFYQIGAELLGPEEPSSDAEIITMVWRLLERIGITKYLKLELSSLGDENCRPQYKERLIAFFTPEKERLCEDCQRRLETNPLRILDCKVKGCRETAARAPRMIDSLCPDCSRHLGEVKESLDAVGVPYVLNPGIVRGLDYYTRTVFEITTEELGSQNAVAAGGRYDGLVEELGGPRTPAVGFAVGMERLILLHQMAFPEGFGKEVRVFIAHMGEEARKISFQLASEFRNRGISTEMEYGNKSLKSQFKRADKLGVKYTIIIGDDELKRAKLKVKQMDTSIEKEFDIDIESLIKSLKIRKNIQKAVDEALFKFLEEKEEGR